MEKVQIVKYAFMQITALVYGILFSGATVKLNKPLADMGYAMPDGYYHAIYFRDHGMWLFVVVILWTVIISYLSTPVARFQFDETTLTASGLVLAVLLATVGTIIAFGGAISPHIHITPLQ